MMIQDIAPHKLRNEFIPGKTPAPGDLVLHFRKDEILVKEETEKLVYPTVADFARVPEDLRFLFSVDEKDLYVAMEDTIDVPDGFHYINRMSVRSDDVHPKEMIFAMFTAQQLWGWYRDNVFCGTCGTRTEHSKNERAMVCSSCRRTIYPRILPAVIVAVRSKGKILLTKYANRPFANYALIAGFTEIGETLEETVQREVMEEVGLPVKNIRYYKSQPWGIADDILMGFTCEVDGDDDTIRLDKSELKEGGWFAPDEVILQPNHFSLTNEMMEMFKNGKL